VSTKESAATLTVKATSTVDTTKSGMATVTVVSGGDRVTSTLAGLVDTLYSLADNTATNPHTVVLDSTVTINTADTSTIGVWATINRTVQAAGKYVILDISACTAVGNTIVGAYNPINNLFNIIRNNQYIKGITLPSTLTSIGSSAFYDCNRLTSVTIPGSVTSIEEGAFARCSGLTSVTFEAGSSITTAWSYNTFSSTYFNFNGDSLWTAYTTGSKAGTYTRSGSIWTQQS
jgi:hypothetical protein